MCKRTKTVLPIVVVTILVTMFGQTDVARSQVVTDGLLSYWTFDAADINGQTASDVLGGRDGTIIGNTHSITGKIGDALTFDGDGDYVEFDDAGLPEGDAPRTVAVWIKPEGTGNRPVLEWGTYAATQKCSSLVTSQKKIKFAAQGVSVISNSEVENGQWYYIAETYDGSNFRIYIDGVLDEEKALSINTVLNVGRIGADIKAPDKFYNGAIDEVSIYDRALSAEEIAQNFAAKKGLDASIASVIYPDDGAIDVPRDMVLSWEPGGFANTHDVYLGTDFNDVNDAGIDNQLDVLVFEGHDANSYDIGRLELGQTYYWRIDEVNAPPDSTVYPGKVWSFTTELLAYPIENVTATASSSNVDEGAENTVNGSGVDANDLHSAETTDMWRSSPDGDGPAWIEYQFDRISKLHEMWVWNHNSGLEKIYGFGFKDVLIEYSADGIEYKALGTTHEFAQAPGTPGYAHETIDFAGAAAKYVRLTANSTWGSALGGLSEVRFFRIPVYAKEPYPDSEAMDVDPDVVLGWKKGREAVSHDVYVGADPDALTLAGPATEPAFDTASLDLGLGQTYYWRVDEVNDAEATTTWQGDIWSFSTPEYLVVDDFESYNDIQTGEEGSDLVYMTWIDGYVDPPAVRTNGSTMGHTVQYEPSMEDVIVYDGSQSAPFYYDNSVAGYSEVTANLANLQIGSDWTKHGIKALTLRFFGDPNNSVADRMYVKLNGSTVTYDGDPENVARIGWQMWYIDLALFDTNLSNVTDLAIGFERVGAVGGQGVVLFDGIRLYSYDRQLITPAEPGTAGLQAHYEFEGTTNDSSGNARHGTAMGNPVFEPGKIGQAISFDGLSDYVNIDGYKGVVGDGNDTPPWTVAAWVRTSDNGEVVGWGSATDEGNRMEFRINGGRTRAEGGGGATQGDTDIIDGQWHHIAVTVQPNSVYSTGIDLWLDGQLDTRSNNDPDPWHPTADFDVKIGISYNESGREFTGSIDEVRIYDRVLSQEEIAGLAGRTKPFDKPF